MDLVWTRNEGAPSSISDERVLPLHLLPDGMVSNATNVDLDERGICIPRSGITAFSTSGSPPTSSLQRLFGYVDTATDKLLAFDTTSVALWTGSTWTSLSNSDTSSYTRETDAVHYNGKIFLAYDSSVNRLHVLEGGTIRRVGLDRPSAPTTADTAGAGSYSGERYFKVQMRIYQGASTANPILATSELSEYDKFTPSGSNVGATITKPTTVDSATHWVVFASADDITYYDLSGPIAVGTTTYATTAATSTYPTGDVAPEVGFFVPPPSAKFLATDGTRLLMAGAHESSATSSQTAPNAKRVWFTRPLGATDGGDDEAITQSETARYWIDIDDPNHTHITALFAIGGTVYVGFARALWRLVPSGLAASPYRAEQVSGTIGPMSQQALCIGGSTGNDAAYFVSQIAGLHRVSPEGGLEWLGRDVIPRTLPTTMTNVSLAFDPVRRDLWVFGAYGGVIISPRAINVQFLRMRGSEPHGGARVMTFTASGGAAPTMAAPYAGTLVFGGEDTLSNAVLNTYSGTTDNGTGITASVNGPVIVGRMLKRLYADEPIIGANGASGAATVGYADVLNNPTDTRTIAVTLPASSAGYVGRVHGLTMTDAASVRATLSLSNQPGVVVESLAFTVTEGERL